MPSHFYFLSYCLPLFQSGPHANFKTQGSVRQRPDSTLGLRPITPSAYNYAFGVLTRVKRYPDSNAGQAPQLHATRGTLGNFKAFSKLGSINPVTGNPFAS